MKYFRFKKQFASYGASRTGNEDFDRNSIFMFEKEFEQGYPLYPINFPRLWIYPNEVDEVTDEKEIEAIKKEYSQDVEVLLKKQNPKGGLGSFAFKKGNKFIPHHHIACHATFRGAEMDSACTWNLFLLKEEEKKSVRELIEWLVNDSPWVHCIAPRWDILSYQERTDRALEGPVPVNMEAPANEVVGFAVAMRTITEHKWVIATYLKLREMGASRVVAFMLAGYIQYVDDKFVPYHNGNWHHFLDDRMDVKDVCKFFKEGYFREGRSTAPFNKRNYTAIAEQVAKLKNGEGSFSRLKEKHQNSVGQGFARIIQIDAAAIIKEINEIWSEA